jgi:asparagine N-glycosylation enzyme membrane subunit Stt3
MRSYRDSALAYAALGSLVVIFAYVTGSSLVRSLAGGVAAFALATAYTWWRLWARQRQAEQKP